MLVCHDDLIAPSVSYLGDMKLIMKSRNTVQIIQSKLKSKSSMQFERFDVVNGKFESKGILTRTYTNKRTPLVVDGKQVADNEEEKQVDHGTRRGSYQLESETWFLIRDFY